MSPAGTTDFTLKYRVWSPHGQHNGHVKPNTMAWSKAYENRKRANRYHSDMENDRVKTYRRIASTMFNDGFINMDRVLVLFTFTSQMGQQYPTDTWRFWDIYRTMPFLKGQNTNISIDRSSPNHNRVKGTNQKAPLHKQLNNWNTEWLSNQKLTNQTRRCYWILSHFQKIVSRFWI